MGPRPLAVGWVAAAGWQLRRWGVAWPPPSPRTPGAVSGGPGHCGGSCRELRRLRRPPPRAAPLVPSPAAPAPGGLSGCPSACRAGTPGCAQASVCRSAPNFLKTQQSVVFKWPVQSEGCGGVLDHLGVDSDLLRSFWSLVAFVKFESGSWTFERRR